MKAMILAAGHGKRMGALTADKPKPLLTVKGVTLLENKILALKSAGITDIIINVAYLGEQIQQFAGDGSRWQVDIHYSVESEPLETAGGIARALPLLGDDNFLIVNADIWTDYPFERLVHLSLQDCLGYLVMVDNPHEHQGGDLALNNEGLLSEKKPGAQLYTYSGIAVFNPRLIRDYPKLRERFPLLEVFQYAMAHKQLRGEHYSGVWRDIGTPERLAAIQ